MASTEATLIDQNIRPVVGTRSVATLSRLTASLLDKPGGYLSNDVLPPSVFMDNVPRWEFGVLVQCRDFARALRNTMSRSQSQSAEDQDLVTAENQLYRKQSQSIEKASKRWIATSLAWAMMPVLMHSSMRAQTT